MKIDYTPRDWQAAVLPVLKRFTVLVLHRRAGKTVFDVIQSIGQVLACPLKNPRGAYFGPTRQQTKDTAWDYYKMFLKPLTDAGLVTFNESDLTIKFKNGARINLYSYENLDNIRGAYLDHVVLDEFQLAPPMGFDKVVRPMLSDRIGKAIITGTPDGKTEFFDFYEKGLDPDYPAWSSVLMKWDDTNAINLEEINDLKKDTSDEAFDQEYNCSFEAAVKGAYIGKNISKLKDSDRLREVLHDPAYPVVTGWDLGLDGMVIWYFQKVGDQERLIDVDYFINKDLPYCANKVLNKPYTYHCQYIPHDGTKRTIIDKKKTAKGLLESLGLRCKLVKRGSFDDAVHATRVFMDRIVVSTKCDKKIRVGKLKISPLDLLSLWRAKTEDSTDLMQKNAKHDFSSHIADGLRTLAVGIKNHNLDNMTALHNAHRPGNMQKELINTDWNPYTINIGG